MIIILMGRHVHHQAYTNCTHMLCSVCMGRGKFTLCLRQVEITSGPIMPSRLLAGPTNIDADGEGKPKKHRP